MESVFVHLRDASESEVADYLARTYPFCPGPNWIMDVAGDPALYIDFYRDLESELEDEEKMSLAQCLSHMPTVSVVADISGRHLTGDSHVRDFVCGLLTVFEGVAQDDYTYHWWTREQIITGYKVQGHPFFDYWGWRLERKADGGIIQSV